MDGWMPWMDAMDAVFRAGELKGAPCCSSDNNSPIRSFRPRPNTTQGSLTAVALVLGGRGDGRLRRGRVGWV